LLTDDFVFEIGDGLEWIEFDLEVENIFFRAAANSEHAVGRNFRSEFAVFVIHFELAFRVL
jgi:hypothetical protein